MELPELSGQVPHQRLALFSAGVFRGPTKSLSSLFSNPITVNDNQRITIIIKRQFIEPTLIARKLHRERVDNGKFALSCKIWHQTGRILDRVEIRELGFNNLVKSCEYLVKIEGFTAFDGQFYKALPQREWSDFMSGRLALDSSSVLRVAAHREDLRLFYSRWITVSDWLIARSSFIVNEEVCPSLDLSILEPQSGKPDWGTTPKQSQGSTMYVDAATGRTVYDWRTPVSSICNFNDTPSQIAMLKQAERPCFTMKSEGNTMFSNLADKPVTSFHIMDGSQNSLLKFDGASNVNDRKDDVKYSA